MAWRLPRSLMACLFAGWVLVAAACTKPDPGMEASFLIRVGQTQADAADFQQALDFSLLAYPDDTIDEPEVFREIQIRVFQQLGEELLMRERSRELDLHVSDGELAAAVNAVRQDYPEGLFDQIFLQNAVSRRQWQRRLQTRLLRQKVLQHDLGDRIQLETQDIADYINAQYYTSLTEEQRKKPSEKINAEIIARLQREKIEEAYPEWLAGLRRRYGTEINLAEFCRVTGLAASDLDGESQIHLEQH